MPSHGLNQISPKWCRANEVHLAFRAVRWHVLAHARLALVARWLCHRDRQRVKDGRGATAVNAFVVRESAFVVVVSTAVMGGEAYSSKGSVEVMVALLPAWVNVSVCRAYSVGGGVHYAIPTRGRAQQWVFPPVPLVRAMVMIRCEGSASQSLDT
jgi:hypothetical protein